MNNMNKLINLLLDLPKTVNDKLPENCFNKMMDDSEGSIKKWTGTTFKVGALVLLVVTLIAVVTNGIDTFSSASGLGQVSAVICLLILVYAAFPIAHIVRKAGDSLSASKSNTVDFLARDFVIENIKALGHITALVALFGAICSTVGWVLNSAGMSMDVNLISAFAYATALPTDAAVTFLDMIRLGFVGGVLETFNDWSLLSETSKLGWSSAGLVAVGYEYVQVILILAKLYLALAIYHFFYGILSTLTRWIQKPSLPFKTS
jgi:hypothetical protein